LVSALRYVPSAINSFSTSFLRVDTWDKDLHRQLTGLYLAITEDCDYGRPANRASYKMMRAAFLNDLGRKPEALELSREIATTAREYATRSAWESSIWVWLLASETPEEA